MTKRFGRNQRRKMREEIDELEQAVHVDAVIERGLRGAMEDMKREHSEQIHAARTARDMIRLDVDALIDPEDRRIRMMARFDNLNRRGAEIHSAYMLSRDEIIRRSDIERDAWINVVGKEIAKHALVQIMRHWRSR